MPKLVVIYGINNIGKTTQCGLLEARLKNHGHAKYIKIPVYDLEPTGPRIKAILRQDNPEDLSPTEIQKLMAVNRHDLFKDESLNEYEFIVFEDYYPTSIAWGMIDGVEIDEILDFNKGLPEPDLGILLHGEYFKTDIEKDHVNERSKKRMEEASLHHEELAIKYNWKRVDANRSVEEVHEDIWKIVSSELNLYTESHADSEQN